jgi:CRISPR-associated protein Cas1
MQSHVRPHSFRDLPKLRDSLSYLYVEHVRIEQTDLGVEFLDKHGHTLIPIANLTCLLLGPGSAITHAAVQAIVKAGCLIVWCGEEGVRCYAQGLGETHQAYKLMRQAELTCDPVRRLQVVERMYRARFREPLPAGLTLQQIRGLEGQRVRQGYAEAARKYGIRWEGRSYDRGNWNASDPVNRALSAANACLHGICHAAVLTAGYSPGLGFIHQGKQLAFVYDIADLYKMRLTVPVAFATVAEDPPRLETEVRKRLRQAFRNMKLLARILPDIERLLQLDPEAALPDGFDPDLDPALPTPWWTPPEGADTRLDGAEEGDDPPTFIPEDLP